VTAVRAAVLDDAGLRVRDWPDPSVGPGEALVALTKVGICGSDAHFVIDKTTRPAFLPIVLGHEPAGQLVELGPGTQGPALGTRVALIPLVVCGVCARCRAGRTVTCPWRACLGADRDGCWADLVVVPVANLITLPDGIDDATAAVATDSVANAHHAVITRGALREGDDVAVWGAGGLGCAAIAIARTAGAGRIVAVDPSSSARARARAAGADEALTPEEAADAVAESRVDLALEFVGRAASVRGAVRGLADGGRAVIVGLGDEPLAAGSQLALVLRERSVVGSYGAEPHEVATVIDQLANGTLRLPGLIAEEIELENVGEGVRRVAEGAVGRVVVAIG
jgi:threonine dehydrogenase-like Zn-dependent dehydrogenase